MLSKISVWTIKVDDFCLQLLQILLSLVSSLNCAVYSTIEIFHIAFNNFKMQIETGKTLRRLACGMHSRLGLGSVQPYGFPEKSKDLLTKSSIYIAKCKISPFRDFLAIAELDCHFAPQEQWVAIWMTVGHNIDLLIVSFSLLKCVPQKI